MNSVKLQDTKSMHRNPLYFYTLINNRKRNNPIYNSIKKNKIKNNKIQKGINLTKGVGDLCPGNYRILMRETEEDTNKWKDIYVFQSEELILLKCPLYPKPFTDLVQSLSKFQWLFSQK